MIETLTPTWVFTSLWLVLLTTVFSLLLTRFKPPGSFGLGGGGGGDQTSTQTSEPPAFVKPFSESLLQRALELSRGFAPQFPTGEESVAGFSPDELQAFGATRGLAGAIPSDLSRASQLAQAGSGGSRLGGLQRFTEGDIGFDPITNSLVNRSQQGLIDQFNTQIAPSTASRFQQGGTFGGTAQQELESSQRFSLARALGETEAGIRGQSVNRTFGAEQALAGLGESRRNRQLGASGLLGTLGQTQTDILRQSNQDLLRSGTQQRGLAQAIRDVDVRNLTQEQLLPLQQLDILGSAIGTASGGFNTITSTQPGNEPNPFLAFLGAGGSFLGGLGGLLSSKTFKYDDGPAERILDRLKILPVRTWRYKGSSELHLGPYAEDFQEIFGMGNGKTIPVVDAFGILFQSMKELAIQVDDMEARYAAT